MAVHHSLHIRPGPVYLGVNEALQVGPIQGFCYRISIEVVADDIPTPNKSRGSIAREKKSITLCRVAYADMAHSINDAMVVQNSVRVDKWVHEIGR